MTAYVPPVIMRALPASNIHAATTVEAGKNACTKGRPKEPMLNPLMFIKYRMRSSCEECLVTTYVMRYGQRAQMSPRGTNKSISGVKFADPNAWTIAAGSVKLNTILEMASPVLRPSFPVLPASMPAIMMDKKELTLIRTRFIGFSLRNR